MKIVVLILLCLQIYSCNLDISANTKIPIEIIVPQYYLLKSENTISIKNDTVLFKGIKYNGYLYQLSSITHDTILLEGYVNGLLSGKFLKWFENKQLMEERIFQNGKKNGIQIAYWPNGNKRFEFNAKEDAYEGELKEWSENGRMFHLANYVNGQEEGTQKMWYDNGKIRANYVIIQGKRYGLLGTKNCKNVSDSFFLLK